MPLYDVTLEGHVTATKVVRVEADGPEAAEEKALNAPQRQGWRVGKGASPDVDPPESFWVSASVALEAPVFEALDLSALEDGYRVGVYAVPGDDDGHAPEDADLVATVRTYHDGRCLVDYAEGWSPSGVSRGALLDLATDCIDRNIRRGT